MLLGDRLDDISRESMAPAFMSFGQKVGLTNERTVELVMQTRLFA